MPDPARDESRQEPKRPMSRQAALAVTALIAVLGIPGQGRAAPGRATTAAPQPAAAQAPAAPRKATPQERAEADRLSPLAQAAFWGHEVQVDPADAVAGVK